MADLPVTVLRGVGDAVAADLAELGIISVLDLVTHYPRRYIDGTRMVTIDRLAEGEKATVLATVRRVSAPPSRPGRGRRAPSRVQLDIVDGGGRMRVVFFNQSWRARQLPTGTLALFFGPVTSFRGDLQMANPTVEVLRGADESATDDDGPSSGRIYPVYPLTEKAVADVGPDRAAGARGPRPGRGVRRPGPTWSRDRLGLLDRTAAFAGIHRPGSMGEVEPARRRLAFDELLRLQLALVLRRQRLHEDARGIVHVTSRPDGPPPWSSSSSPDCPFPLTGRPGPGGRGPGGRPRLPRCPCTACSRATSAPARRSSPWRRCCSGSRAATRAP